MKYFFLQSETKVHHKDTCSLANNHKLEEPVDENKGLDELLLFINGTDTQKGETIEEKALSAKAAKRARQKQRKVCNVNRIKLINIWISYLQFRYLTYLRQNYTIDPCSLVFLIFFLSTIMFFPFWGNIVFRPVCLSQMFVQCTCKSSAFFNRNLLKLCMVFIAIWSFAYCYSILIGPLLKELLSSLF